ncbi:MAG: serine O-acetyltransferase EpsC [Candidatus Omnitrophota bacterium]
MSMLCFLSVILWIIIAVAAFALLAGIIFSQEVRAALERDPAAKSRIEIIFLYSGFHAMVAYRIARALLKIKIPFLPRALSQLARFFTGIEIHPGATIGKGLFIDHGMGVVIGETSILGDNITLYQGVTLGGTGKEKGKRHPTLGNNVVIGTGAKVLGNITIGDNSYIGANAVVIKDVPANSTVVGVPGRITKQDGKKIDVDLDHIHIIDPIMQNIEELEKRIEKLEKK